ncbi:transglutaminase-like putative cysteine protease [Pseudarthrobacter defluvii]|nr:transglutaminase-like putative cysteine protease [Pseudarthrobacter defluvii]
MAPARPTGAAHQAQPQPELSPGRTRLGAYPWAMAAAITVAVCGAALSLNGVLRGWNWFWPAMTTVLAVGFTLAALRSLRAQPLLVTAGGFLALGAVLTLTFFRSSSLLWVVPTGATLPELDRLVRRASETVLSETAPVAPNAGIVLVVCAVLGLAVILVDALAVPLAMPAASGTGLLALLVVPAMIKPQSVGVWSFVATAAGYLLILGCSQWFAPDGRLQGGSARSPGLVRRAALTGAVALASALVLPLAIPGFDRGSFPQGSRLNPWGAATGLNPMITLGNSLRAPDGSGRITYATTSPTPLYLRSVTVDNFDGDSWGPDDRNASRVPLDGRIDPGYAVLADEQVRLVTAIDAGSFTSPYLPVPYAPEAVRGLGGQWTWDPATLSIKGTDTSTRRQEYLVTSAVPKLSSALLAQSTGQARGIPDVFTRIPGNVPDIVKTTAQTVAGAAATPFQKAMAMQRYLRSSEFTYSLQSPVQGGYDGNGLSVLADFLQQKSGYCIHYASAMAVMARLEGIPSRIAVGYAPGRLTGATVTVAGQGPLPEYEADARDAHAWPELYFQGLGWVPFEPTPSRGVVPDYATEASVQSVPDALGNNDGLIPDTAPVPTPTPSTTAQAVPGAGSSSTGSGTELMPWLLGAAAVAGLALLAATPHLVRAGTRSRRLRPKRPEQAVPLAWSEIRDLGTDYGLAPADSETPRAYSSRFRGALLGGQDGMDRDAHQAVASLTAAFEHYRYGRPSGGISESAGSSLSAGTSRGTGVRVDTAVADISAGVAAVEAALRANATLPRRLAAAWLPPSVTRRLGLLFRLPFRAAARAIRAAAHPLTLHSRRETTGGPATTGWPGKRHADDGGRRVGRR